MMSEHLYQNTQTGQRDFSGRGQLLGRDEEFRLYLETAPTCQPWLSSKHVQKLPKAHMIGVVKGDTRSLDPKP